VFSDRSLYRPGQTVYFKAIGISKDKATGQPIIYKPGSKQQVVLYNANNQKVDSLELVPNDFGSINGQFKLPATGLTGNFRLEVHGPNSMMPLYIRVEEYKRPKFSVAFTPVKESYRLNDTVKVTGNAKAFAGNNIDNAKVSYQVYRQARMLYPWLYWGRSIWPPARSERMQITAGQSTTNAAGNFEISFSAIPDLGIDPTLQPAFDYFIEAQVTDQNGESHSSSTTVSVGYQSIFIESSIVNGLLQSADSAVHIKAAVKNLQQQPQETLVKWQISTLKTPERLMRKRYWQVPDTTVMSRQEFVSLFPYDPYLNEDDYQQWEKREVVLNGSIDTKTALQFEIAKRKLAAGYYLLEMTTTDKDGKEVTNKQHFAVYDLSNDKTPAPHFLFERSLQAQVQPGDAATFLMGSNAGNLHILQQVARPDKNGNEAAAGFEWLSQNKALETASFAITENDRGGFTVRRFFVSQNRFYNITWQVQVPWSNKQLDIQFETFRNKLLPGQQETWKVKVKGAKGEKIAAEMLASMYDASLDQIYPHNWMNLFPWNNYQFGNNWRGNSNFRNEQSASHAGNPEYRNYSKIYDALVTIENDIAYGPKVRHMAFEARAAATPGMDMQLNETVIVSKKQDEDYDKVFTRSPDQEVRIRGKSSVGVDTKEPTAPAPDQIQIRKNFNETAFFFPTLQTDAEGNISFSFTMPEALTQWKLQLLAHTQALQVGQTSATAITQKDLMVQPNAPRFLRQGDKMELAAKVVNLSDKELTGTATLELLNATTMQPVDGWLQNVFPQQYFTVAAGQSTVVKFPVEIPVQYTDALVYRITAKAGNLSDGEEMALPVLSNRMLVTESFPINMRGSNSKNFNWQKLLQSENSPTLQHQSFTIEYTSNPVWLAIQSLPYLAEYPYECAEQIWNRFYANALAAHIAQSFPKVKAVLAKWKDTDTTALLSNLQKNEQLKQALLEETPWVLAAKNENEQRKNLSMLFDVLRLEKESEKSLATLEQLQSPNGGFVWFKGGPDDRYMTQYIISGMGHLRQLKAWPNAFSTRLQLMANKGIAYLDARMKEDYDLIQKNKTTKSIYNISTFNTQYLYMRSFFTDVVMNQSYKKAYQYFFDNAKTTWPRLNKQQQGMIALVMHRGKVPVVAQSILKSLAENSIISEEFGMYWKEYNNPSWYWWQAPVESHSLLLEAFAEIENNKTRINDLKTWLLKQKQTTSWESTKATAEACYALLMTGTNWLEAEQEVSITAGNWQVPNQEATAGTGYFSGTVAGEKVKPEMGNISVRIKTKDKEAASGISSWGAAYWQYFEELDKVTEANTSLAISKKLMLQTQTDAGMVLQPIDNETALKTGDRITVRIEIRSDRQLEYVHLKDLRAACLEPVDQLSSYRWQGGLGYYQAPKDASMHFFISYLPKGTYVFEYPLVVTHEGNFSNGISTIQCMYAPEFSAHSSSQRMEVKNQ
jgi:uncharacterized protein YfaS (alpha-2-macroglobulin family)